MDELIKWKRKKKHIFIFSNAGRPIYSRYPCDEQKMAGVTGVLVAMIEFVAARDDDISMMQAGSHKIVFLKKDPIFCVMVADTTESIQQMTSQLEYMHSQIISLLTAVAHKKMLANPRFDLRDLLGGTDKYFNNLSNKMNRETAFLLDAMHCLRLKGSLRTAIGNIMQAGRQGDLFYALLITKGQLVQLVRPKKHILTSPDLHLVINFVNSSDSFRASDATLTPICLPTLDDNGFLYLYVCYLSENTCLLLLSLKPDDFPNMSACKDKILEGFKSFYYNNNKNIIDALEEASQYKHYTVDEIEIPGLFHFVYKWHDRSQITQPEFSPPYHSKKERQRLFRLYQNIHHTVHVLDKPHKVYYYRSYTEVVVGWMTKSFDLYACFTPTISKSQAVTACNQLIKWIKDEELHLFIMSSPIW
eukprot:TRINITY_DN9831_c0_g1_i1.p1 TRINITY_DN9831_c0_g1~~TRINITY_DN9831_c0_g1_i1.p1  ORF type:complete len:417 (+),score=41.35 TRINITY_DN9831_c0_g1_i1:178-1428(+)